MKLKVEGIVCTGCEEDMKKILSETDGVLDASVNYADETIHPLKDGQKGNRIQSGRWRKI